jgi:hypothetical protein
MRFFAIVAAVMVAGVFSAPAAERERYLDQFTNTDDSALEIRDAEAEPFGNNWKREAEAEAFGSNWKRDDTGLEVREAEAEPFGNNWKREPEAFGNNWKREPEPFGNNWKREPEAYGSNWKVDFLFQRLISRTNQSE